MLIAGRLLLCEPANAMATTPGAVRISPGWVRVDAKSGRIAGMGEGSPPGRPDLEGRGDDRPLLISPAFVDTHLHLPQFDSIGADGLELLAWLERVVFPAEARWADADYAGQMAARAAKKLLAHGTTGVAAYGTVHHEGTKSAMVAAAAAGLRGVVGQVLMDQQAPAELVRPAAQLLREAAGMKGVGRIGHAVTPRFAVSCSRELLAGAGELARTTGAVVQTHLSETREECRVVRRLHGPVPYTEVYRRAGLLGARTLLGHGIWLKDRERAMIAASGAVVAHCPTANLFLGAGSMNLAEHRRGGVRVSLGSDVAGGPDVAMPRVGRAMIETAKRRRMEASPAFAELAVVPSAAEAWWRITAGNAGVLGLEGGGRLEAGAPADVVVIDPARGDGGDVGWAGAVDPLGAVLYGWDSRWITHTIAGGRVVYEG